jgi:hypothetical protein
MRTNEKLFSPTRSVRAAAAFAMLGLVLGPGCDRPSATSPEPPGGGESFVLNYQVFATQIDTILTARGCDDLNCHGGGIRGTFELSPVNDKDVTFDFAQVRLQVNGIEPPMSTLLMKPLDETAGGSAHGGGSFFTSTADPDYQALLTWIEAGEFQ